MRSLLSAESIECYELLHNLLKGHTIPKQVDEDEVGDDEVSTHQVGVVRTSDNGEVNDLCARTFFIAQ